MTAKPPTNDASSASASQRLAYALRRTSAVLATHLELAMPFAVTVIKRGEVDEYDVVLDVHPAASLLDSWQKVAAWASAVGGSVDFALCDEPGTEQLFHFTVDADHDALGYRLLLFLRHPVTDEDAEFVLISHMFADIQE